MSPARKVDAGPRTVQVPELRRTMVEIAVDGTTPLITHAFSAEAQAALEATQQGAARTKKPPRDPLAEFESAIYRTPDARPAVPAIAFKLAAVRAGQRFGGERSTELLGAFSVPAELLPIESPDPPAMRADRVVLAGASRTTSIAYRPMWSTWSVTVPIVFNADFLSLDQLVNLFRLAGFSVGIAEWRPERRGTFGQFEVRSVREIQFES